MRLAPGNLRYRSRGPAVQASRVGETEPIGLALMNARIPRLLLLTAAIAAPASGGTLPQGYGWHALPNTKLRPLCPSLAQYPALQGGSGCAGIVRAWGGGAFDPAGNRLFITGGGHADWAGNEVYELDLDTVTMRRLNAPSYPVRDGCEAANDSKYADGRPVSRHTYNHLEWLPGTNELLMYGGSRWECGFFGDDTWVFDPAQDRWTELPSANAPMGEYGLSLVRDPVSGLVYARDTYHLWSWSPMTRTWTQRSNDSDLATENARSGVVDPVRRRYFFYTAGSRTLHGYDISAATGMLTIESRPAPTCTFMDEDAAGWAYDAGLDRIVAWNDGNFVHLLDGATATCRTETIPGGPGAVDNGTYGRFRYSPAASAHVVCSEIDDDCYLLRLEAPLLIDGFE